MKLCRIVPERRQLYPCGPKSRAAPGAWVSCLMWFLLFPQVTFPSAQVPRAPAIPLPWPPPPQEPLQLQLLPISRATEALPCDLYPIQLTFVTFLAEGGSVGKKSLTQGQASKVKAVNCYISPGGRVPAAGVLLVWGRAYKNALQFSG